MGRHLTSNELDDIHRWFSHCQMPLQIHSRLVTAREKTGQNAPSSAIIRSALTGATRNRSRVETRGRKNALTTHRLEKNGRARVQLIEKADG